MPGGVERAGFFLPKVATTSRLCKGFGGGFYEREQPVLRLAPEAGRAHATAMSESNSVFPKPRRSACADAALRAEISRVEKMTVEERIKAALSLGKGFSGIQTTSKNK
jgi:hypothetical protein